MKRILRYYPLRLLYYLIVVPIRPIWNWIGRLFIVQLAVRTFKEMSDDDATHMAAGVAYYSIFSLFPLLLGLIAAMSIFMSPAEIRDGLDALVADYLPASDELIDANLEAVLNARGALGLFAVLGLLWSGSAIFGAISRAINRAWDVHVDRPFFISKPRQMAMAASVGILFFCSMTILALARTAERISALDIAGSGAALEWLVPAILQGGSLAMTVTMFLLMYKFMPNTKTYWRYVWPGALVAGLLFELSKNLFITYLGRFASFESVYGALAPVVVLLLWTYLGSLILVFGAQLSSEFGRLRRGVARGVVMHPTQRTRRRA